MSRQKQAGFAIVEAALIVVVLGLLVGVGFFVLTKIIQAKIQRTKQSRQANQSRQSYKHRLLKLTLS